MTHCVRILTFSRNRQVENSFLQPNLYVVSSCWPGELRQLTAPGFSHSVEIVRWKIVLVAQLLSGLIVLARRAQTTQYIRILTFNRNRQVENSFWQPNLYVIHCVGQESSGDSLCQDSHFQQKQVGGKQFWQPNPYVVSLHRPGELRQLTAPGFSHLIKIGRWKIVLVA